MLALLISHAEWFWQEAARSVFGPDGQSRRYLAEKVFACVYIYIYIYIYIYMDLRRPSLVSGELAQHSPFIDAFH
jgi:hypothetical protein